MKNILITALLAALVTFIWSSISWMVLPFHNMSIHKMKNEDQMIEMMKQNLGKTRVYAFPAMDENNPDKAGQEAAIAEKYRTGPMGMIFYHAEGGEMMDAKQFIFGFLLDFIIAGVSIFLLIFAVDKLPKYLYRVLFVTGIGLIAALSSHIMSWNWMMFPMKYSLLNAADLVATFFFAGLIAAWRIKPQAK